MRHTFAGFVAIAVLSVPGCLCLELLEEPDGGVGGAGGSGGGSVGGGTGGGGSSTGGGIGGGTAGGSGGGVGGGTAGGAGGSGGGVGPACTSNVGMPQVTGPLTGIAASYAKGAQMTVSFPVDADTRRVQISIYDYNSTLQLGSSAVEVTPSSTATLSISAGTSSTPAGTYYVAIDLCSTSLCTSPLQRNYLERKTLSSTIYSETRTITGMGTIEICTTGIPLQTFQIQ